MSILGLNRYVKTAFIACIICSIAQTILAQTSSGDAEEFQTSENNSRKVEDDILDLDIDKLGQVDVVVPAFDVEVTSVTRRESTIGKSPAAVFVITQEMIRRSGATSLPEALRMAPGIEVAKIDNNRWAITARGFNSKFFANKLLVMIDGRSVYTPLFSGVHWDVQDTLLEDIERIEVIRGPGGTVWGANAVNGVINIITKKAKNTQGTLLTNTTGTEDRTINGVRYGGKIEGIGTGLHYRIYGKQFERDRAYNLNGAHDDWRQKRFGFRADWSLDSDDSDSFTVQGDYFDGISGSAFDTFTLSAPFVFGSRPADIFVSGQNVLGRWTHRVDETSDFSFQAYYDNTKRLGGILDLEIDIFDVEFLHRFSISDRQKMTWGARYRYVTDSLGFPSNAVFVDPASRQTKMVSTFIQDEIVLIDETLSLTVGSKFEHNDYSGFEYQPGTRLLWTIDSKNVAWASASRAVRTPSRLGDDVLYFANVAQSPPTFVRLAGSRKIDAEDVWAYEMGYRSQVSDRFSWDLAVFYNDYNNLVIEQAQPIFVIPPAIFAPSILENAMEGETYGFEISATHQLTPYWKVFGSYSFLQMQMHSFAAADNFDAEELEGASPHNRVNLQSSWDLPKNLEFDIIGRYVDELPSFNVSNYLSLDMRIGYRPNDDWELSIVGQNLLEGHRKEFASPVGITNEIDRAFYGQVVWRR